MFIKNFSIRNLFGYKNVNISFDAPIRILLGENGFGKTTVLNALNCVLTADYQNLLRIRFDSIYIEFGNGNKYEFTREIVKGYTQYIINKRETRGGLIDFIQNNVDETTINVLIKQIRSNETKEYEKIIREHSILSSLPSDYLINTLLNISEIKYKYKVLVDLSNYINSTGFKVLYYPTYRRIEEDIKNIIKTQSHPRHDSKHEIEMFTENNVIKFGMADVDKRIKKILNEISQSSLSGFAAVSGGMISKLLDNTKDDAEPHNFNIEEIKIVLSRVGVNISEADKCTILKQIEEDKNLSQQNAYLRYFLDQLLSVYKTQQRYDTAIKQFADTCNQYFTDKEFVYNESNVTLNIYRKHGKEPIELKQLSSGEKQIVSIFSQLYLEPQKKFIILFDEPELSLSIYWQEKLLPDMVLSGRCEFLLAVTHSPFIFNNELKQFTKGINEYVH